jgi:hypothetical protein
VEKFIREWVKPALDEYESRGGIKGVKRQLGMGLGMFEELYAWRSSETSSYPEREGNLATSPNRNPYGTHAVGMGKGPLGCEIGISEGGWFGQKSRRCHHPRGRFHFSMGVTCTKSSVRVER